MDKAKITTKNAYDYLMKAKEHLETNKKPMNSRNVEYVEPIICVKGVTND